MDPSDLGSDLSYIDLASDGNGKHVQLCHFVERASGIIGTNLFLSKDPVRYKSLLETSVGYRLLKPVILKYQISIWYLVFLELYFHFLGIFSTLILTFSRIF